MGFFNNKKHNFIEDDTAPISENAAIDNSEPDDFDGPDIFIASDNIHGMTRKEFHEMAEANLQNAINEGAIEATEEDTVSPESTPEYVAETVEVQSENAIESDSGEKSEQSIDTNEFDSAKKTESITSTSDILEIVYDDNDDFDDFSSKSAPDPEPIFEEEQESDIEKENKQRMTFKEFCQTHHKGIRTTFIVLGAIFAVCLGLYIYGCATVPEGVMGRNIYIEDINISNLTYDEALEKVKTTSLLDNCDITVSCKGMTYTINGLDVGLSARIEDTVDKAMRYGKTGNILIDGFANALQLIFKRTVMPSANVNQSILREKLTEFGNIVHGELVEHKLEVGDGKIICTPGHTGFSGNTDKAYEQIVDAIENEDFSRIRVDLRSAPPKSLTIEDIDAFAYANPQDARFEITDNNVSVVPEVWGRYLDLEAVKPLVSQIVEGGPVVTIPFSSSEPAIKANELNDKLFNTTLGSYYTYYGGSTANRAANVTNAASKINEKVLAPGEVFSFNDTVGKRSTANGFYTAPEYANGQTVMGIGGGTCQVSSTLYNAVLYSDLSIVSRLNHMFTVGYCPAGQDATVSDSGVDFKFANNTDYPIKISSVASGGKITVSILGTERDVPHTVKLENYSYYSGDNRTVRTYRMVYDPQGALIRKEELPKSYYMAH